MSQNCATPKCERTARALCDCCKQTLCLQHLNEHNASLISQLNPLTDEINAFADRLKLFDLNEVVENGRRKLEQWQKESHEKIDQFFEKKCQELEQLVNEKYQRQQDKIDELQSKLTKLISEQEATRHDIDTLTSTIRELEVEMKLVEQTFFQISARPLFIDDNFIQIRDTDDHEINISNLKPVHKTLIGFTGGSPALAINDQFLLIHERPNLCLVDREMNVEKQIIWEYGEIWDMCWSSALDRFIIIEDNHVFLLDDKTMSVESVEILKKQKWWCCACSDTSLFLSTKTWGSSIVELKLLPSILFTKEWNSPVTCTEYEVIDGLAYSSNSCVLVIKNKVEKSSRIELRSCATFSPIWSCVIDGTCNPHFSYRCCSLPCDEWLVMDSETKRLLQISKEGEIKANVSYNEIPYCARLLGSDTLSVSTDKGINFHRI